jgi:hypothetical protein
MPIYDVNGKKCLFIHIPKCGGSSIERWLEQFSVSSFWSPEILDSFPCTPQHFHSEILEHLFCADYFDYVFTVCRNPIDRLLSEYKFRMGPRRQKIEFSNWLYSRIREYRENNFTSDNHLRPQYEFLAFASEVFHFEEGISNIVSTLSTKLGVPGCSEVYHEKRSIQFEVQIDQDLLEFIENHYKRDFETFGYSGEFNTTVLKY